MDLIYCGKGNVKLDTIAIQNGFRYGLRLPNINYLDCPLYFADQDWKKPNKEKYLERVALYKPTLATVIDFEHRNQMEEVMDWSEKISLFVDVIIIIPKCTGVIKRLPREINGKEIRLGFSVPTKYGATSLGTHLFDGWNVHLLGGSPHSQIDYCHTMNVVSVDCNYHSMKATKFGEYWTGKFDGETSWWRKVSNCQSNKDRYLKAFELSCKNIYKSYSEFK